jgi:hypothetical protein
MNESSWPSNVSDSGMLTTTTSVPCHEHWRKFPPPRPEVHYVVGTLLVLIGTTGALGNSLVLFVFTRYVERRMQLHPSERFFNAFIMEGIKCSFNEFQGRRAGEPKERVPLL